MISFYFLFFCGSFVVYGLPRLLRSLAMTAHTNSSLRRPKACGNLIILSSSLRGFEKAVAISVWQQPHSTHTVIVRVHRTRGNLVTLGSSLREPKVRGNLIMEITIPKSYFHCKNLWQFIKNKKLII